MINKDKLENICLITWIAISTFTIVYILHYINSVEFYK